MRRILLFFLAESTDSWRRCRLQSALGDQMPNHLLRALANQLL